MLTLHPNCLERCFSCCIVLAVLAVPSHQDGEETQSVYACVLAARRVQERGRPYVIVFCGVNGVGKSTNLAKIAFWLGQHGVKVSQP